MDPANNNRQPSAPDHGAVEMQAQANVGAVVHAAVPDPRCESRSRVGGAGLGKRRQKRYRPMPQDGGRGIEMEDLDAS
jgi:hypothetical protein